MANIISAVFNDRNDAERAVDWLRDNGVQNEAITIVGRGGDSDGGRDAGEGAKDAGSGAAAGMGIGAGVGALFGLAALAIPGVGPFIAAGALANLLGATGGAIAAGAIVGAASGGLAGALGHWGLNEAEAHHYAGEVERGGTYVGVNLDQANIDRGAVLDALRRYNGHVDAAGTMAPAGSAETPASDYSPANTSTYGTSGSGPGGLVDGGGTAGTMAGGSSPTMAGGFADASAAGTPGLTGTGSVGSTGLAEAAGTGTSGFTGASTTAASGAYQGEREIRVPIVEEQADIRKVEREVGEVAVTKEVDVEHRHISEPVTRTDVDVQVREVPAGSYSAADATIAPGQTIRIPVTEEELIVDKHAEVTGEAVIRTHRETEVQDRDVELRRERVDVQEVDADDDLVDDAATTRRGY